MMAEMSATVPTSSVGPSLVFIANVAAMSAASINNPSKSRRSRLNKIAQRVTILFVCKMMARFKSGKKPSSVAANGRLLLVSTALLIVSNPISWKYVTTRRVLGPINSAMSLPGSTFCANPTAFERNALNSVENPKISSSGKAPKA